MYVFHVYERHGHLRLHAAISRSDNNARDVNGVNSTTLIGKRNEQRSLKPRTLINIVTKLSEVGKNIKGLAGRDNFHALGAKEG